MVEDKQGWISLGTLPEIFKDLDEIENPIAINNHEFIICTGTREIILQTVHVGKNGHSWWTQRVHDFFVTDVIN